MVSVLRFVSGKVWKKKAAANVSHEMSFIAKQVDEAIENSKNLTLHRDATTKY
jgi:aspartate ammonia-lyase